MELSLGVTEDPREETLPANGRLGLDGWVDPFVNHAWWLSIQVLDNIELDASLSCVGFVEQGVEWIEEVLLP